ncbi:MAG: hypothetical protein EHM58_08710 [Ignavibacteriae bacterium]|nr:MAG: hypothetical protein EHM58_08710 [Ignavibacteriota bacterium]
MIKSKLFEILKTFTAEELKGFRDFVHSPFHNRNKKVRILYEIIKKYIPDFENDMLKKEKLYRLLYPGKPYNDVVMRILISDLLKLSEEYLAYQNYRKNSINEKKFLLDELKNRKLDSLFRKNLRQAEEILCRDDAIDFKYFYELQNLQNLKIEYLISRDKQSEIAGDVLKQGEYLIYFTLSALLNTTHELLQQESVLNINFGNNLVKEFFDNINIENVYRFIESSNSEYGEIASIYYYMYKAYMSTDGDTDYFKLKNSIEKHFNKFTREEKFNLLLIMESICTNKVSFGKQEFYSHLMDIYELMLSDSIWGHSDTSFIQLNLFRNIFFTAVILEKYEWAEEFVSKYKNRLIPEQRDNMLCFSNAIILFEKGEFEKALAEINKVNYNFFVFKFDARVLLLKIYCELELSEQAYSLIDSFSHFLANNKNVCAHDRERFGKFIKYIKLILKYKDTFDKTIIDSLENLLEQDTIVIGKKWITGKLKKLNHSNLY